MKKLFLLLLLCQLATLSYAQTARDYAVELRSNFDWSNNELSLSWPKDTTSIRYDIYGKSKTDYSWTLLSTLGKFDSSYIHYPYTKGYGYDFWVKKRRQNDSANGYIHVSYGPYHPLPNTYGKLLLVIDSTYCHPLASEIARLQKDLENEGWEVVSHIVQRTDSVQKVKRWIHDQWLADSASIKSLLLLGRVPVPYSGNFNPDAHPDHKGAWPADVYYVTFDLTWTDNTVNTTTASRNENDNIPGDNKFDQDYIWPELAKIPMGRIDLFDMPDFGNDTLLMKRYLDKNHAFRTGQMKATKRALIDDNFGAFGGEAFASNGWRVFTPMFDNEVHSGDYFPAMGDSSFLFSYACGGGSYTSAGGVGTSSDFVNDSLLNPFTMLFGSYFGDWDNSNNFLRAPLASKGWGLASAWAGRPLWMFHHAAVNEPIGFASIQAQNAYPTYEAGYSGTYVHIALMGDPSLRLYVLSPVKSMGVAADCGTGKTRVRWNTEGNEADSVEIWAKTGNGSWQLVARRLASDSTVLLNLVPADYTLRIYAMDWELNPSGFFKVLSHPLDKNISVKSLPVAQMQVNKGRLCYGDTLFYSDLSTGNLREWWLNQFLVSTATDSFMVLPDGNNHLSLKVTDSSGCTAQLDTLIYQAPQLAISSIVVAKSDTLPACDSMTNLFLYSFNVASSNLAELRVLILWDDSLDNQDILVKGGTVNESKTLYYAGNHVGRIYVYDSTNTCMIEDSMEIFVAPKPAKAEISPAIINLMASNVDFRASYYDASASYLWQSTSGATVFTPGDSVHKVNADFYASFAGYYGISLQVKNQYGCMSDTSWAFVNYLASLGDKNLQNWSVFPNPSTGKVFVSFDGHAEIRQWTILNALGQSVIVSPIEVSDGIYTLDFHLLPKGIYFIQVQTNEGSYTSRIVKE